MAQIKPLKMLSNGDWSQMDTASDDLTANSFTGDGSALTNIDADNISTGTLDPSLIDGTVAGNGLNQTAGVLSFDLDQAQTWEAAFTFDIAGGGNQLTLQADAADAETKLFQVKDASGFAVAYIDEDGDMVVNDLTVNGVETVVGTISAQSALDVVGNFSVSGNVTLGNEATDDIYYIGRAATDLNMNNNDINMNGGDIYSSGTFNIESSGTMNLTLSGTPKVQVQSTTTYFANNVNPSGSRNLGGSAEEWNHIYAKGSLYDNTGDSVPMATLTQLNDTTDGSSGADVVGATAVGSGVATTVQGILEELNSAIGSGGTDISSLIGAIGASSLGGLNYNEGNYVTSGSDALDTAIGLLDAAIFDNAGDISTNTGNISTNTTNIGNLQTEVDNIETAMGSAIGTDGTYNAFSGTNYIDGNSNVSEDLTDLDTQVFSLAASASAHANLTLNNLGSTAVNASIIPSASGTIDLGSATYPWNEVYTDYINNASNSVATVNLVTLTDGSDALGLHTHSDYASDISTNTGNISTNTTNIGNLQTEVNNIETAMGSAIGTDGTYVAFSGTNYIDGNSNVSEDLTDLDTQVFSLAASASAHANLTLNNLGSTAVNADIIPDSDGDTNLGSSTLAWSNVYTDSVNTTSGTNLTLKHSGSTKLNITSSAVYTEVSFIPANNDKNLGDNGASSTIWNNLYVQNIESYTGQDLTISSGLGASLDLNTTDVTTNSSFLPSASGTLDLGSSSLLWNDIFVDNIKNVAGTVDVDDLITLTDGSNADALHVHASMESTDIALPFTASGAIAAGAPVYVVSTADNTVAEGDASVIGTSRLAGIASAAITDSASGNILIAGFTTVDSGRIDGAAFTRGQPVYLSENTGKLTSTAPTTSGARVYQVGIATTTTSLIIDLKQGVTIA